MDLFSADTIEQVNKVFNDNAPISTRKIDFKNPYFTQPKSDRTHIVKEEVLEAIATTDVEHLYIHVPFCMTRCFYCHYPRFVNAHSDEAQNNFLAALKQEIEFYRARLNFSELKTIHIGGGTPNLLGDKQLDQLLHLINSNFQAKTEFAIEVYPSKEILTDERLRVLQQANINRISIGVQSFNNEINLLNDRINQPTEQIFEILSSARELFENISIDLLYGQKGQTLSNFMTDLDTSSKIDVDSIYLYQTRELMNKRTTELQLALNQFLFFYKQNGYDIVSFDQVIKKRNAAGFCSHRSGRSKGESLLGLGPGAVTEIGNYIYKNKSPEQYIPNSENMDESSVVRKSDDTLRREYLNRALRHFNRPDVNGIYLDEYSQRFGSPLEKDYGDIISFLEGHGIVKMNQNSLEISNFGMLFTQQINYMLLQHYK